MGIKVTNKEYIKRLEDTEFEALECYQLSNVKILHKHKVCGHIWKVLPNNIYRMKKCPNCSTNQFLTDIEYKNRLENSGYKVLESYKGTDTKILHEHKVCSFQWKVSPHDLRQIISCPQCVVNQDKSKYLYYVYFPDFDLYKIGISCNWESRLHRLSNSGKIKYEILMIEEYTTGIEAYEEEQKLLKKLKPYLYETSLLYSGNKETFKWPIQN